MTDTEWKDVERLLSDLKADGYEPTLLETVTSAAVPEKKIQINVERQEDDPSAGPGDTDGR
jgi:hypothetical protein